MRRFPALAIGALVFLASSAAFLGCSGEEPAPQTPPTAATVPAPPGGAKGEMGSDMDALPEEKQYWVSVEVDHDWGAAPYTVNANAVVMGKAGVPPYTFTWEFGDGSPFASGQSVTHVYAFPGTFHTAVVMRDEDGKVTYDFAEIWVEKPGED